MLRRLRPDADEGFTLIELLIVIIVLGILVAIVLFSLGTFKSDSQSSACAADTKQLRTAETAYFVKNNASTDVAGLVSNHFLQSAPDAAADGVTLTVSADANGNITVSPVCP
jgi:prepilin-type N-terminal cleavage/methylation domain-containing protein